MTLVFHFAYGFTLLPGYALCKFYVYIIVITIFSGVAAAATVTIDAAPHRAESAAALALPCVPATFGAEY